MLSSCASVKIDERFEAKFQVAEDVKLLQLQALADFNLSVIEQSRLNETETIAMYARRDRDLQEASADVVTAQLRQQSAVTTARTAAIKEQIQSESKRIQSITKRNIKLDETKANQGLNVQQARRQVVATMELARTERLNMITSMEGRIRRAYSNRTRDLAAVNIERTRRLERLESTKINRTLAIFQDALEANVSAYRLISQGLVDAEKQFVDKREATDQKLAIQQALNLTDNELAAVLWHRALGNHTGTRVVSLDYNKVPFLTEFGGKADAVPKIEIEGS